MSDSAGRARGWYAWRIGWVLLALLSLCVSYGLLVIGGR